MSWEELKQSIGDDARDVISCDRGNSDGKLNCVCTAHAKGEVPMSWIPDGFKWYCHDCTGKYDIIDHCKYIAHDDLKEAYRVLCDIAGEKPSERKQTPFTAKLKVDPITEPQEIKYPAVETMSDTLFQRGGHYLTGRGISRDTLIDYKVTSNNKAIFFNYFVGDIIVKVKGRAIGDVQNGKDKYRFTPKGGSNVLYGQHLFKNHRTLAICEGEIDALSLHTALVANGWDNMILASSIPSGSGSTSWIENSRCFIEQFESVLIIPDNDDAGDKFLQKAGSELMMIKKIRYSTLKGTKCNDINELLQKSGAKALCSIVADSKEYLPDFTVDLSTLPYKKNSCAYEKSGFFMLDKILRGLGHGLLTLFTGHTGAGKTTIIRQIIIFNVNSQKRIGAMMGEETQEMFREMILRQAFLKTKKEQFSLSRDEFDNVTYDAKPELIDHFNAEYAKYISSFNCNHLQNDQKMKKIYEWIKFEANIYNTRLFILDNLMKLEVGIGGDIYAAQGDIIDQLKNIASALNVHIILIAHPKKGQQYLNSESVSGSQKIANTVDNMISFQRFDKMDPGASDNIKQRLNKNNEYDDITAFIKLEKNRVWAKLATIPMRYNEETNCIHDMDPENRTRYGWTISGRTYEPEESY